MRPERSSAFWHGSNSPPSGASGLWVLSDFTSLAGGNKLIYNRAAGTAPTTPNLFIEQHPTGIPPENLTSASPTSTTTGVDGRSVPVFTVPSGSPWNYWMQIPADLLAGTYTLGIDAKLVSGSGHFFLGGPQGPPSFASGVQINPGAGWQSYSRTFMAGGGDAPGYGVGDDSAAGSTFTIAFDNIRLYQGASDVGANNGQPSVGHLYPSWNFPNHSTTAALNYAGGVLTTVADPADTSSIGMGFIEFPNPGFATGAMTVAAYVSAQAPIDPAQANFQCWFSGVPQTWVANNLDFLFIGNSIDGPGGHYPGIGLGGGSGNTPCGEAPTTPWFSALGTPGSAPFTVVVHTWDGTTAESWINGVKLLSNTWMTTPPSSANALDMFFNLLNAGDHPGYNQWKGALALYPRKLSDGEVAALTTYIQSV